MRFWLSALLVCCALGAAAYGTFEHVQADRAVIDAVASADEYEAVRPLLDLPLSNPRSYRVSCGTVDGGVATDARVPFDGGGPALPAEDVFVSNHNATCVRVSGTDVTSTNGVEIGTGAGCIDGPNVNMEARFVDCKSEGAAQFVDVTLGRR